MKEQENHMQEAIRLSIENVRSGHGGPFGAVIVKDGQVIASGANEVTDSNDPTAHAEVVAIRRACEILGSFQLEGCEIYCSCEPCPMCLGAIYWARPAKVFYANTKKDAAEINFDDDFIYQEIELPVGERKMPTIQIMRNEALEAFELWRKSAIKSKY